jgi:hypothetical protein
VRQRVAEADFPETPDVYVVYAGDARPLYVGVAATQSIRKRWRGQHLRPRAGGSALRRTLGVHLGLVETKLRTAEGRYYPSDVEAAITSFLETCEIEFHLAANAAAAQALEAELIGTLGPTLNVRRAKSVEARAKSALAAGLRAVKPDLTVDERGYVVDVADNLLPGISRADIEADFARGAGNELEAKMLAPWSSSALAVNSFARWRRRPERLLLAGLSGFAGPFAFEAKCDHGVRGEWPHLDVLLHGDAVVGVESKCIEYTRAHSKPVVSDAYWALRRHGDARVSSRWFAVLEHVSSFARLDAYQLVKHYLGLVHSYSDVARTLVYLYWEPENNDEPLFREHRTEIERFSPSSSPVTARVGLSQPRTWTTGVSSKNSARHPSGFASISTCCGCATGS